MYSKTSFFSKPGTGKWLIAISIIVSLFWIISHSVNVYTFAISGAIFELLALPMLACALLTLIVASMILLKRNTKKQIPILAILIIQELFFIYSLNDDYR